MGGALDDGGGGGLEGRAAELQGGEQRGRVHDPARDVDVRGEGYCVEVAEYTVRGEGVVWKSEGGDADGAVYDEELKIMQSFNIETQR